MKTNENLSLNMTKAVERFKGMQSAHKTAVIIAVLAFVWMVSGVFKSADDAALDGSQHSDQQVTPRVRVTTLHSQHYVPTVSLMGRTVAGQAVSVRSEIPGRVLEVVATKGQMVEAGAVLLRIDSEDRPQLLAEARARLKQRQIAVESAKKLSKGGYSPKRNGAQAQAD